MRRLLALVLLFAAPDLQAKPAGTLLEFSETEVRQILQHGPWPPPWKPDPSNRASGKPEAIAWGERLFFEPRLSKNGSVLCATCHVPYRGWQDGAARARGLAPVDRNTPSLFNMRYQHWFGWDGAGDSLWAQSIRPILDEREMGLTAAAAAKLVRGDPEHACGYEKSFGARPPRSDEAVLAGIGKALAAFQETLVTGRTAFDDFRDALASGDKAAAAKYPLAAQRGLRTFVGKGNCSVCHLGPAFTNGEFHDIGVPFFIAPGKVDPGRHGGIQKLRANPWNQLGRHSDDKSRGSAMRARHVNLEHRNFGEFKVPGLRNVAQTAPYTHHGRLATLGDMIKHYSELDPDRVHSDGEAILKPLKLSAVESADLVAFLESLTERTSALPPRSTTGTCRR